MFLHYLKKLFTNALGLWQTILTLGNESFQGLVKRKYNELWFFPVWGNMNQIYELSVYYNRKRREIPGTRTSQVLLPNKPFKICSIPEGTTDIVVELTTINGEVIIKSAKV